MLHVAQEQEAAQSNSKGGRWWRARVRASCMIRAAGWWLWLGCAIDRPANTNQATSSQQPSVHVSSAAHTRYVVIK
jgi:hypothetical protein